MPGRQKHGGHHGMQPAGFSMSPNTLDFAEGILARDARRKRELEGGAHQNRNLNVLHAVSPVQGQQHQYYLPYPPPPPLSLSGLVYRHPEPIPPPRPDPGFRGGRTPPPDYRRRAPQEPQWLLDQQAREAQAAAEDDRERRAREINRIAGGYGGEKMVEALAQEASRQHARAALDAGLLGYPRRHTLIPALDGGPPRRSRTPSLTRREQDYLQSFRSPPTGPSRPAHSPLGAASWEATRILNAIRSQSRDRMQAVAVGWSELLAQSGAQLAQSHNQLIAQGKRLAQTHRQIAERERGRQVVCAQQAMEQERRLQEVRAARSGFRGVRAASAPPGTY